MRKYSNVEVPRIDLGDLATLDDFREVSVRRRRYLGKAIVDAYHRVGFAFVRAPRELNEQLDDMYNEWEKVFAMSEDDKMSYWGGKYKFQRGYTPLDTEQALFCKRVQVEGEPDARAIRNFAENWFVAPEDSDGNVQGSGVDIDALDNVWPLEAPDLRQVTTPIHNGLLAIDHAVMRAAEPVLHLPKGYFDDRNGSAPSLMRLLHYPSAHRADVEGKAVIGACQHTDINDRTWLPRSRSYGPGKGLEVRTRDGRWISGKAPEGYVITQVGDMFQHSTGGYFLSAQHRVESPIIEDGNKLGRFSCALFIHPRSDYDLGDQIDLSHLTDHQKHYGHITAHDKLHERLSKIELSGGADA